ncbi:MAG: 50S ribosomal protein L11 methyltransferase [Bacteroidota bacterium]
MPLRTEYITIGDRTYTLRLPADIDAIYDALIAKGEADPAFQDQQIPYWADLWPSAIALGQFLTERVELTPDIQVLELGCGLGLSGLVAALMGASVIQTDYLPDALELARLNASLNMDAVPEFRLLDWREPDLSLKSPVILAADIAYEERAFAPVAACFKALLAEGGSIYLSEPGRAVARPFPAFLEKEGFILNHFSRPIDYRNIRTQVSVYHLMRK